MGKTKFPSHGQVNICAEGQLLVIKASGPANIEMIEEYRQKVGGFREQVMHAPWGSLVLMRGTPLVTAEAKNLLSETISQAKLMGLVATSVVFVEVEFSDAIKLFWREVYQDTGVNYHFFDTEEEARIWLDTMLDQHSSKREESSYKG